MSGFVLAQGTTFVLGAQIQDRLGAPVDLTGATLTAQMRDALDNVVATLAVTTVANRPGVAQISFAGDTATWPVGRYRTDLRVVWPSGLTQQTRTYTVTVVDSVTRTLVQP